MPRAWPNLEASTFAGTRELFILTAAQSREVDRLALTEFGLPTLVLMENAARAVADVALDALKHSDHPAVLILAGPGNNGGDALAAARHLHNAGAAVDIVLAYPPEACKGDCALHLRTVQHMNIPLRTWNPAHPLTSTSTTTPTLIIDGLFGTGLARPLDATTAALIHAANALAAAAPLMLAVDLPTGMDADSGNPVGESPIIRADATVTFAALKPGLLALAAQSFVGEVIVGDIGVPQELLRRLGTPCPAPHGSDNHTSTR